MTFEELKELDKFHNFSDFNTIKHDKEVGSIPTSHHVYFNDICDCGSERIISINHKQMMCCNPRCPNKIAYSLAYTFAKFGIKELGVERCRNIVNCSWDNIELKSHVSILKIGMDSCFYSLGQSVLNNFRDACIKIMYSQLTLSKLVSNLGFPSLGGEICDKLLNVRSSMDLLEAIENKGGILPYCFDRGVFDTDVMFNLRYFLEDIGLAESLLINDIESVAFRKVPLVITGSVFPDNNKMTREEFIYYMNKIGTLSNGVRVFEFYSSKALASCDNIIADSPSSSEKYLYGLQKGILCNSTDYANKYRDIISNIENLNRREEDSGDKSQ